MLFRAFLLEHLTKAPKSGTRRLSHDNLRVLHPPRNKRPEALQVRLNEQRAPLNDDSERRDGRLAHRRIGGGSERLDLCEQGREDLRGRQGRREGVDDSERSARGDVLFDVGGLGLRTDREEGRDDRSCQVEGLDLGLFAGKRERSVTIHLFWNPRWRNFNVQLDEPE